MTRDEFYEKNEKIKKGNYESIFAYRWDCRSLGLKALEDCDLLKDCLETFDGVLRNEEAPKDVKNEICYSLGEFASVYMGKDSSYSETVRQNASRMISGVVKNHAYTFEEFVQNYTTPDSDILKNLVDEMKVRSEAKKNSPQHQQVVPQRFI